jgi:hypothetical protein
MNGQPEHRWWLRRGPVGWLYSQNPFYLIGTFLILFGLQQSLGKEPQLASSGLLALLIGGYTLLLAGVAIVIVRFGRLWIALLFYMLSTSLDVLVLETPLAGSCFLAGALLFSLAVSETVLAQLKLALPAWYKSAFYGALAMMFVFPILLAWLSYYRWYELRSLAISGFGLASSLPLLALVPAVQSRRHVPLPCTATWQWPWYPWSLFAYLSVGIGLRSWWLTISFDPTKGEGNCFQPYFLLPLVLVWAVILLEAGIAYRLPVATALGMVLPWAALGLGYWTAGEGRASLAMLESLRASLGTPPQLAVWSVLAFHGYAMLRPWSARATRWIELSTAASGLLACITTQHTVDWRTLGPVNSSGVMLVAGAVVASAIMRRCSYRALVAAVLGGGYLSVSGTGELLPDPTGFWHLHAPLLILLAVVTVFDDRLAQRLRGYVVSAIPTFAVAAAAIYPWWFAGLPEGAIFAYLVFLTFVSCRLWLWEGEFARFIAAAATASCCGLVLLWPLSRSLSTSWLAAGLPYLASGLAVVAAGMLVSLIKMGLPQYAWQRLATWNERLFLPSEETNA